jgi:hypothetical protein
MSRDPMNSPGEASAEPALFSPELAMRLCASAVGIVTILIGLWLALTLFGMIAEGLRTPEAFTETWKQWAAVVGGDGLKLKVGEQEVAFAPAASVAAVGMGLSLLTWLSLGVMLTGAKIVAWASGEREAVKRVLQYALGKSRRLP